MKQEPKSNSNFDSAVREKGSIINKGFVNEQGSIVNKGQISESQKQLVRDDKGLEAVIKAPTDSKNQIFGDSQPVEQQQESSGKTKTDNQQDNNSQDTKDEETSSQEYDVSQQSYSPGYKNYANRVKFETIQNQQAEQPEEEIQSEYSDVINYGNEPVILGQNDVLPEQPNETFQRQADYINYGTPKNEGNTEKQAEYDTYGNTDGYNNFRKSEAQSSASYDYTRPYVSSAKKGYAEQVIDRHETADKGMVKNYDNARSVINNTENIPIVNKTDGIANIREKPSDILSGLKDSDKPANEDKPNSRKKSVKKSQKPNKSLQGQTENQAERQAEEYSEKPPKNNAVYNSSPKQGCGRLVKEYQRKAVKDIIKEQSNKAVIREEGVAPILQPSESAGIIKNFDYDNLFKNNGQNSFSADKNYINNTKRKINPVGKKSAADNKSKVGDVDMPDVVLSDAISDNEISEIDKATDISNEPFTYKENEPNYINSKTENIVPDIIKSDAANDIITADYGSSVVKTSKELVSKKDYTPVANAKEKRSDFSQTAHKKAVREYQKSIVKGNNSKFSERKADSKTDVICENTKLSENIIAKPYDDNIIKSEKTYDNVIIKTQNRDLHKENAAKNIVISKVKNSDDKGIKAISATENILTTGVIPQKPPENQRKPEQARQFTEMPKIKHSQNISSKAVSKTEASRTTKGDFRRSASKATKQAEKTADFSYAVMPTGKTLIKNTVKAANTAAENILTESKGAVKNSLAKAIEENADNSLAITAVDKGIKTADTITTTVKGTKAVVKTGKNTVRIGKEAVKTAASAPKNIYSGAVKLKRMSNKLRKMAQMKKIKQLKLVGKGLVHIGKMAVTAALKLLSTLLTAVSGYIIPILIIIIAVFIIVAVVSSLIPAISLKADDEVLTQVWEYVTEKDADFEIEYKNEFNSFPQGVPNYKYMDVKKYFSVNGTQVLKDEREYNNIATMYDAPIFDAGITYSEINKTSFKTNIDALLIYLDAKYEDYEFSEVQTDIDELYNKVLSVQYVNNIDNPSIRNMGDNFAYVYILNLNLHYKELKTYIQENIDVLFTNNEAQTYDVLDEVGQYMTKIELGKPIETDDASIACQKRYGYYADTDTNEKKFYSGIDITASPGTNVLSPISGKIDAIDGDKIDIYSKSSKRIVSISNVTGISVSVGDTVKKGSVLGSVDGSGYICLEYKIKKALSEVSLNPSFYIDNLVYTSNASSSTFYDVAINLDDYINFKRADRNSESRC
ncbi:MAG: peptidoglycan DD-metalloendopeptidase family protein [Clostridiales bacterium]|nr:peptidoglycan DD-metalloendopeptidase family protein [Clostridiales bacterium]